MKSLMQAWKGTVEFNGTVYQNLSSIDFSQLHTGDHFHIRLGRFSPESVHQEARKEAQVVSNVIDEPQYRITVRQYMLRKSSPDFDFMAKWNNDVPMPLCMMTGTVVKETRGMVYMKLHGDMYAEVMQTCMCCGRPITNPVSRYFGLGPICGGHNYVNPFETEKELKDAVAAYRKKLQNITWEGWIIKSAIIEKEEVA